MLLSAGMRMLPTASAMSVTAAFSPVAASTASCTVAKAPAPAVATMPRAGTIWYLPSDVSEDVYPGA